MNSVAGRHVHQYRFGQNHDAQTALTYSTPQLRGVCAPADPASHACCARPARPTRSDSGPAACGVRSGSSSILCAVIESRAVPRSRDLWPTR
jgi:hypothetical protein